MDKHKKRLYSDNGLISVGQSFGKIDHDFLIDSGLTEFRPFFEIHWKTWRKLGFEITDNKVSALFQNRKTKTIFASVVSTSAKHNDEKKITFYDISLTESRQGAPSSYKVDISRSELYALRWVYKNERLKSGSYWAKMISDFPKLYDPTLCSPKITQIDDVKWIRERINLSPIKNLPSPAYLIKHTYVSPYYHGIWYCTNWKWRGKKVRMGEYWYNVEKSQSVI